MNAAETIAAAIDKLEGWRSEVDVPPLARWTDQERIPGWDGFIVIGDSAEEGEDCNPVARVYTEELANMLVGLHRTIDAQLGLLRAILKVHRDTVALPFDDHSVWPIPAYAMDLARAILGEDE